MERHWLKNKIACWILITVAACMLTGCQEGPQEEDITALSEGPVSAVSEKSNETVESYTRLGHIEDRTKNVIHTALDAYGDLDIVINNAAIGEQKMIDETDER